MWWRSQKEWWPSANCRPVPRRESRAATCSRSTSCRDARPAPSKNSSVSSIRQIAGAGHCTPPHTHTHTHTTARRGGGAAACVDRAGMAAPRHVCVYHRSPTAANYPVIHLVRACHCRSCTPPCVNRGPLPQQRDRLDQRRRIPPFPGTCRGHSSSGQRPAGRTGRQMAETSGVPCSMAAQGQCWSGQVEDRGVEVSGALPLAVSAAPPFAAVEGAPGVPRLRLHHDGAGRRASVARMELSGGPTCPSCRDMMKRLSVREWPRRASLDIQVMRDGDHHCPSGGHHPVQSRPSPQGAIPGGGDALPFTTIQQQQAGPDGQHLRGRWFQFALRQDDHDLGETVEQ